MNLITNIGMSLMGRGGLAKLSKTGGIKPGEFTVVAGAAPKKPAHVDSRLPRTLTGKAMLMVDAQVDATTGERLYSTIPSVKSAVGDYPDDAYEELKHFGTNKTVVPNQCRKMGTGDRWRIDVVYRITYEPVINDKGEEDWEVSLEFLKAKTRAKSPWNEKRHAGYVSKAKRAVSA